MNRLKLPPQLTRNFWKKFVAFLLATVVWYHVRGEQMAEKSFSVPLELVAADGMTILDGNVKTLQVVLTGPQEKIEQVDAARLKAKLDLRNYTKPTSVDVPLMKNNIRVPRGLDVARIYPSHAAVKVDQMVEKTLAVHPVTVGKLADGYRLAKLSVNPTVIAVKGPQSVLSSTQEVATAPIDLTGKNRSFLEKVPLKLDAIWADPETREKGIEVLVTVDQHLVEKRLENVSLHAIKGLEDKRVLDSPTKKVSLWVQGSEEMVKLVRSDDVTAFVDVGRLTSGTFELPVQVNLPTGVTLVRVEPSQVELRVSDN